MERVLAIRSVSITEFKRNPSAVLKKACAEPVAVLNRNRPMAYLLAPHFYNALTAPAEAACKAAIQEGIDSGPAISADLVFTDLKRRFADMVTPVSMRSTRT